MYLYYTKKFMQNIVNNRKSIQQQQFKAHEGITATD